MIQRQAGNTCTCICWFSNHLFVFIETSERQLLGCWNTCVNCHTSKGVSYLFIVRAKCTVWCLTCIMQRLSHVWLPTLNWQHVGEDRRTNEFKWEKWEFLGLLQSSEMIFAFLYSLYFIFTSLLRRFYLSHPPSFYSSLSVSSPSLLIFMAYWARYVSR